MSREANVGCGLRVRIPSTGTDYRSYPTQFTADVDEGTGPVPGEVLVGPHGLDIDLSLLTTPGLCRIQNRALTGYILVGINNGTRFYPMLELLPGESYVMRLYRSLGSDFIGSGTGTPTEINQLHIRAHGETEAEVATARVLVEVFGK